MSLRRPTKSNYGEPARVQQPPDDPPQDYPFEEDGLRADSPEDDQLTAFMDELNMSNDEDDTPSVSDSQPLETAKHGSEWLNELEYLYEDPAPFFKNANDMFESMCFKAGPRIPITIEDVAAATQFHQKFRNHLLSPTIGISKPTPFQAHMWPIVLKGRSVACISGPGSGKTSGYMIPMLNTPGKMYYDGRGGKQLGVGPSFLVLCSTASKVRQVTSLARKYNFHPEVKINSLESGVLTKREKRNVSQGSDIIIATPIAFSNADTNVDNLVLLVLDDADMSFVLHPQQTKDIISSYFLQTKSRMDKRISIEGALTAQIILCAEKCTNQVKQFIKNLLHDPIILIGNSVESMVYEEIECQLRFADKESSRKKVFLDTYAEAREMFTSRIAVCCEDAKECGEVEALMKFNSPNNKMFLLTEETPHFDHQKIITAWRKSKDSSLLIISDEAGEFFNQVSNVTCIVHFSVPAEDEKLGARFQLMSGKLKDVNVVKITFLVLSPANASRAHELSTLLKRLNIQVPHQLQQYKEEDKRGLCRNYATFGVCPLKDDFCFKEHDIKLQESQNSLPKEGQIKFHVTHANVNEIFIRLLAFRDVSNESGKWTPYSPLLDDFQQDLQELKNRGAEKVKLSSVKIGKLFAVEKGGFIHRVKVEEFLENSKLEHYQETATKILKVVHVDFGYVTQAALDDLIPLPENLRNLNIYPELAHKAYVVGIKPCDNDLKWSADAYKFVLNAVQLPNISTAWVYLQNNGIFWLEAMKVTQKLESFQLEVVTANLASDLISHGYAEPASKALPFLPRAQREKIQLKWICDVHKAKSSFAFLDGDSLTKAVLTHYRQNSEMFLNVLAFTEQLAALEKDISNTKLKPITSFAVGLLCLAKCDLDGSINRARIERINPDNSVDVFYLDHGESFELDRDACYELNLDLVKKLPFQAIPCKLQGFEGTVEDEVVYDLTRNEDNSLKVLLVKRLFKNGNLNHVRVYVKDENEDDQNFTYTSLAKLLVDQGHGRLSDQDAAEEPVITLKKKTVFVEDDDDIPACEQNVASNFLDQIDNHFKEWADFLQGAMPKEAKALPRILNGNVVDDGEEEPEEEQAVPRVAMGAEYEDLEERDINRASTAPYDPRDDEGHASADESDEDCYED